MKLIILDGIPTAGKSTLASLMQEDLTRRFPDKTIHHFNDDTRNRYGIDTISLLKTDDKSNLTAQKVSEHLNSIVDVLEDIDASSENEQVFLIERFHFSYLPYLEEDVSFFKNLEERIAPFSFYIALNFKKYTSDAIYNRLERSLDLRGKNHGFYNYFQKLTSDEEKGSEPKERIFNHYRSRFESFKNSFQETRLTKKIFLPIDTLIQKQEYQKPYERLKEEIYKFLKKKK